MSPLRRSRADEPDLAGQLSPAYPQEAPDPYESAADPSRQVASARDQRKVVETRDVGDVGAEPGEQPPSAFRRFLAALGEARRRVLPFPDEVIDQYLGSGERVIYNDHPSFRSFVVANTLHFAGFLVLAVIFLATTFSGSLVAAGFILLVLSVLLLVLVLKRLSNRYTSYVITDTRILRISGIISRSAHSIPWVRVTDLTIEESFLGRLFGYATLRIESANEESGLKDLEGVSNPLLFNQYVIDMVVAKQGPTEPRWAQTGEPAPMPVERGLRRLRRRKRAVSGRELYERTAAATGTGDRTAAASSGGDAGGGGSTPAGEGTGGGATSSGGQERKGYQPEPPLGEDDFDDLDPEALAARLRDSDLPWKS